MHRTGTLSSKHQVTIPAEVRKALGLHAGERIVFDVDSTGPEVTVTLRRSPRLDEIAGSVPVPTDVAGMSWQEIRKRAWTPAEDPGDADR